MVDLPLFYALPSPSCGKERYPFKKARFLSILPFIKILPEILYIVIAIQLTAIYCNFERILYRHNRRALVRSEVVGMRVGKIYIQGY